jgi:acetolactate synthase-1/2/3 large subunit
MSRSGGQLIVDVLQAQGVDRIFGVPGESFLHVLDALVDVPQIQSIVCKHEGAATMMADADGKLTGRPGIAMVTRGPGASNAYSGVHVAFQDSTPMILFVGLISRADEEREAFQEFDLKSIFGTQAKWVTTIRDAARIPELLTRAFATAMNGRPGPVVIGIPEDMQHDQVANPELPGKVFPIHGAPRQQDLENFKKLLEQSERPIIIAGGPNWTSTSRKALADFASNWNMPVVCAFRHQDKMHPDHDSYSGDAGLGINPNLAQRLKDADLIIALGVRLGDCTTSGYSILVPPVLKQKLVHIYPGAEEIGSVYAPALGICSGIAPALDAMNSLDPHSNPSWKAWTEDARKAYLDWIKPLPSHGPVNLSKIIEHLNESLPENSILTNGAGNYTVWLHRFYKYRDLHTQLAPTSGSMGYGLPAAIAGKLRHPDRPVICFAGDGCFQMVLQELGTAMQFNVPIIVIVVNNGMYGTIRMHQERNFPGRVSATQITNPDFMMLAKAYGMQTARVEKTEDFATVMDHMVRENQFAMIELIMDPEDLTPKQTLSQIRQTAQV